MHLSTIFKMSTTMILDIRGAASVRKNPEFSFPAKSSMQATANRISEIVQKAN